MVSSKILQDFFLDIIQTQEKKTSNDHLSPSSSCTFHPLTLKMFLRKTPPSDFSALFMTKATISVIPWAVALASYFAITPPLKPIPRLHTDCFGTMLLLRLAHRK